MVFEWEYHRINGPAFEYAGTKYWYLNASHREDGPAIEMTNGYKCWYLNGLLHKEGGPALEYANGGKSGGCMGKYILNPNTGRN